MSATSTEGDSVELATTTPAPLDEAAGDEEARAGAAEQEPGAEPGPGEAEPDRLEPVPEEHGAQLEDGAPEDTEAAEDEGPAMLDELEAPDYDPLATPPEMLQMLFVDVVLLLPATHPVVVLQEADAPFRELRIPVGGAEGIAIGYAARQVATPRPLTHELFAHLLEEFQMTLDVVRITDVQGSSFTAEMVVSGPMGSRLLDCRPSDAIALALRQRLPAPIMASPIVLALAGTDPLGAN